MNIARRAIAVPLIYKYAFQPPVAESPVYGDRQRHVESGSVP
jgi:hypothetical protein